MLVAHLKAVAVAALACVCLAACGDSGPEVPDLPPGWSVLRPGGDTVCANGSEYAFFVSPGTVNKLLVEFEGGGACWDDLTCALPYSPTKPGGVYLDQVDVPSTLQTLNSNQGIYDRGNPDNPWRDWYHVFVSYCTGDAHYGDNAKNYEIGGRPYVIQHKGRVNAQAAMDWVFHNFGNPRETTVTGCSAGSLGSIAWAPYVMQRYEHSFNRHFGDSFVGALTEQLYNQAFPNWNAYGVFAPFIPGFADGQLDTYRPDFAAYIYAQTALYFPRNVFSQYNSNFDSTQTAFYSLGGGQGGARGWSLQMRALIDEIHARVPNFDSYIGAGSDHCFIPYDRFYTKVTDGTDLDQWVGGIVAGDPVETVVDCAPDCGEPAAVSDVGSIDMSRYQH